MAKEKHEIYDEKDKRLGRLILKAMGIIALVGGIIGPFVYLMNANWGRELGTIAVLCGGVYMCFGPKGRTAGGQWIALLKTLGLGLLILVYFALVIKFLG
ncbi:hypothetical protein [Lactiplantibacillus herbarum]|uniref:hypothetical protein n=1 Tax=Lactiplantibacillus herbarum TaxID=1670446 RepID=UPI00064F43CF|nr:hypothetical protein [Lactiplantibacillus herbarum]